MKPTRGLKPASERRRIERQMLEQERAARGEALEEYLRNGGPVEKVVPELIPTEDDRPVVRRDLLTAIRQAERQPRGVKRNRKLDACIAPAARLELVERVLAFDRLRRASLTPQQLMNMAKAITPEDVHRRFLLVRADMLERRTA